MPSSNLVVVGIGLQVAFGLRQRLDRRDIEKFTPHGGLEKLWLVY